MKVFGIDLGTTYSCVAYVDEQGFTKVVQNAEGELITPSVVFFEEESDKVIVGQVAKDNLVLYPYNVVEKIKRDMGTDLKRNINGVEYTPTMISSLILKKLVNDTSKFIGEEVKDVVITVPAYFGIEERQATKEAAGLANLNVLEIISEPTAAAYAYGETSNKSEKKNILVYDLGGGTFDCTLMSVDTTGEIKKLTEINTNGNKILGGKDWDNEIRKYVIEYLVNEKNCDRFELENDLDFMSELTEVAEKAKKQLTSRDSYDITIKAVRTKVTLTREKFEEITKNLLDTTISIIDTMIDECKSLNKEYNFDEIILVGGSSRMPQVEARLNKEYGKPCFMFDPDQSVAKGAAIRGYRLKTQLINDVLEYYKNEQLSKGKSESQIEEQVKNMSEEQIMEMSEGLPPVKKAEIESKRDTVVRIVTHTYGIKVYNKVTKESDRVSNIIKKATQIPCKLTKQYFTVEDDQTGLELDVFESDSMESIYDINLEGKSVYKTVFEINNLLPKDSPFDVTFEIDDSGILLVTAYDLTNKVNFDFKVDIAGALSEQERKEQKKVISALSVE